MGVRITQRTADKYERLLRYLKQYLAQRGKAEDIPVERMNYEFLDGFNLFLQTCVAFVLKDSCATLLVKNL